MKAKSILNEKGSYYIIIMLVMALIFPLILYITAGFQQQSLMTKKIKQNINRAILAASLQMTSYHDEEETEVPPRTRIIINEERARDAFEAILNDNMNNIGIPPSKYSYDLIIDNGIDEPFPHEIYIDSDILDQYQSVIEDSTTPVIMAKSPTIIAFVKVDTGGMFSINKIQTFRISSSDIIKPNR